MHQAKIFKLILFLFFSTGTLVSCKKEKNDPAQRPVSITVQYPADYYTVIPEVQKKEIVCPASKPEETEKKIEQKAKEIIRKQKERKKQIFRTEKKKEEKKNNFKEYALLRAQYIRSARNRVGATVLNKTNVPKVVSEKHSFQTYQTPIFQDKSYTAANITSSYPVDRSFILTEDRTIPAVLLDSINSQLGGTVRAYISEDVFGADNRYKLLEKGDVVLGRYEPTKKIGETRINVSFYRIIRAADGAEIYSAGTVFAYAADKMGRVGLVGEVDNRNWERYGLAFSTSLIGGLAGLGKSKVKDDEYEEFWNRLSDNTTEITSKILEQYMNIAPIITIAQGEPILIRLASDITLKHPERKEEQHS